MSNKALSILIPIYNSVCVKQVKELSAQAQQLNVDYEIIVADDDSPLKDVVRDNEAINDMPNCQYIVKPTNTGSAATRNFLAERIVDFYKRAGIHFIDVGPSSQFGAPSIGLCNFKESIGCRVENKYTFEYNPKH